MPIAELGHVGIMTRDLPLMVAFYRDVLGLQITDADYDAGLVFLSARPEIEHHELVLTRGRSGDDPRLLQQVSFRVESMDDLMVFHARLSADDSGATIQQEVTHGNAIGIYFFDPEGNRVEVYYRFEGRQLAVQQPYRKHLNFDQDQASVEAEAEQLLDDDTIARYSGASHEERRP